MLKTFFIFSLILYTLHAQISIEQAWRKVEDINDGLKATQNDIERARLKRESADRLDYPSVSLTANYTHFDDSIGLAVTDISTQINSVLTPLTGTKLPSKINFLDQNIGFANLNVLYPLYTGGESYRCTKCI